jgi:hypothetical protein
LCDPDRVSFGLRDKKEAAGEAWRRSNLFTGSASSGVRSARQGMT